MNPSLPSTPDPFLLPQSQMDNDIITISRYKMFHKPLIYKKAVQVIMCIHVRYHKQIINHFCCNSGIICDQHYLHCRLRVLKVEYIQLWIIAFPNHPPP